MASNRCEKCGQVKRRSLPQNRRLHSLWTEMAANLIAADGLYHSMQWWKVMTKDRWLGWDEYRTSDGKEISVLRGTSDLDVEQLNEFMMQVEQYANSRGVYLED